MCDFCNHAVRSPNHQEMSHTGPLMSTVKPQIRLCFYRLRFRFGSLNHTMTCYKDFTRGLRRAVSKRAMETGLPSFGHGTPFILTRNWREVE